MEVCEQQLLEGLRAFLAGRSGRILLRRREDWSRLWLLAAQQKVLPMAADALLPALKGTDQEAWIPPEVRRDALQTTVLQLRRDDAFREVYGKLLARGLRPLVVKGALCRELYPKPELRVSADEDLLLPPEEVPAALEVLRAAGLEAEDQEVQVTACRDPATGLYLELHRSLFPPDSRAYGGLNRCFDGAFSRCVEARGAGTRLWTLCPQDHLLYLILHSFKHFLHSGFGIRQVCDICLFVRACGDRVDWPALTETLREVRADLFAANLLEIGREHLGMAAYPAAAETWMASYGADLDCGDLLADLLSGGVYGGSTEERRHSSLMTLSAVADGRDTGWAGRVLRTAFPGRKSLEGAYPYLKSRPWLLPLAWVQRIGRYGRRSRGGKDAALESVAIGERRVALLKKYRIIR